VPFSSGVINFAAARGYYGAVLKVHEGDVPYVGPDRRHDRRTVMGGGE
jgi:hypothetical protein